MLVRSDVDVDREGNWSITNTFDDSDVLQWAKAQRDMDPYLDKEKRFRRLGELPADLWNNPDQYPELVMAAQAQANGDYQTADKFLRKWLKENPALLTTN